MCRPARLAAVALLVIASWVPAPVDAQGAWVEETKLLAADGAAFGQFGFSAALDGDTALVGALDEPFGGPPDPGAVYVYIRDDDVWSEQVKLTASDAMPADRFGASVALVGDTALVGTPAAAGGNPNQGAAYVFTRSGGVWSEQAKLTAADGAASDRLGGSVALAGDTALLGANLADVGGSSNQGAAYVFTHDDGVWSEQAKLTATDGAAADTLGGSVALSGDTALVGARSAQVDGNSQQGAAYVFTRSDGVWSEQAKLTAADGAAVDFFGTSVALAGDIALVGASGADMDGAVYVFTRSDGVWSEEAKLAPSDGTAANNTFGSFVVFSGDTALVGAPGAVVDGQNNRGAAYVFTRSGGVWSEQARLIAADGAAGDFFGRVALVTAVNANVDGDLNRGAAYAFRELPPDIGIIEGTVRSLGPCGAGVAPLVGAMVEIAGAQSTYTLETGDGGLYQTFLPDSESPLDITVTAPGHLPTTVEGIGFGGGDVMVQDFDLILEAPCGTVEPTSFSLVLAPDQTASEILTLGNVEGSAELSWTITTAQPPAAGRGVADCDNEPGIIVHDDGTVEGGYSANPASATQVAFADRFTPSFYPASIDAVCVSFVSSGPTELAFEIVVLDDDGADGGPGTELGALPVAAQDIPVPSLPLPPDFEPVWFRYDISPLEISLDSGAVFVGVRWAPSSPNVFVAADQSPPSPPGQADGFWWNDNTDTWATIVGDFPEYRSLTVRATEGGSGCDEPMTIPWLIVDPSSGTISVGGKSEVQVSVDSTGLAAGEYRANLCVTNNDPQASFVVIPVHLTVVGDGPIADISPTLLAFEVPLGDTAGDTLSIGNLGDADLSWSIATDALDASGGMPSHDPILDEPLAIPAFEVVPPVNGGTPVAFTLPAGVVTRGEVVGFGFVGTASGVSGTETLASDTCMIVEAPDGTTFGVGGFSGTLPGCAENDWDFQGSGSTMDGTYESEHDDAFDPAVNDVGEWTFTFVHDFNVSTAAPISWTDVTVTLHKTALPVCDDVVSVPWLSASPDAGTTLPGATTAVEVTVDTTDLAVGTFEAALCVTTNDPDAPLVPVPVTLTVGPPATFGLLEGIVRGVSSCVADSSAPLPNATVVIEGQLDTYTVETNDAGLYQLSLDATESPVDITVTAAGHLPAQATDVTVTAGAVTVQDFDLTQDEPCIGVEPESLSTTLEMGQSEDQTLELHNLGTQALQWTIQLEEPDVRGAARRSLLDDGVLLIPETDNGRVMAFDPETGELIDPDFIPSDPAAALGLHLLLHPDGERFLLSDQTADVVWAYDLEGTPLGVFAPAGGPDIGILNNPRGMAIHPITGNLLVAMDGGTNADRVAEFDLDGNFLGDFIDNGAGGINGPQSIEFREADVLVSAVDGNIFQYEPDGTPIAIWNDQIVFPQQILELAGGNVLAATTESGTPGVWELDADGTRLASYTGAISPRGVWELPNGNILTTNGNGVHEIDRGITLVDTKISGVSARMISFVQRLDCSIPDWLTVNPVSGSTEPGESDSVLVSFDAGELTPGEYVAGICVESNDPLQPIVQVPVTLTVALPSDFATIEGTVRSLGHCGAEATLLAGATVEITGAASTVTLETGDDGLYQTFLPDSESPIDITVTAPGHLPATIEDIGFGGGDVVARDFDLVLQAPCAAADPTGFSVDLPAGQNTTEILTLGNVDGGAELEWTITTAAPSAVGSSPLVRRSSAGESSAGAYRAGAAAAGGASTPETAMDLVSVLGETLPSTEPIGSIGGVVDCDADPGLILHDDGTVENGYSGNPDIVTQATFADRFTPSSHPASFTAVCLAFLTLGPTSLDFEIVIFDDDGPDGSPGTELGALAASAEGIPGDLGEPLWFSFDISSLGITIDSGSVYIGVRWTPSEPNVFLASDESPDNPVGLAGGFFWNDSDDAWVPTESFFPDYRSLLVRAVESVLDCDDPTNIPWLDIDPTAGATPAGEASAVLVSIDTTGLALGEYEAGLCIATNDPVAPLIVVPIDLTVSSGTPPVIDVDPDNLSSTLHPGQMESQPLTVANLGDETLDWEVTEEGGSWMEEQKFTASDGAAFDFFGIWVALSGDTALVGASDADVGGNTDQGAAYVFVRSDGAWKEQAKLTASDGAPFDIFGNSVALSGDVSIALIGAQRAHVAGNAFQGAAYVFTRTGDVWTEQAKLIASDGAPEDQFGWQVSLSEDGSTALIGARGADIDGDIDQNQGAAYVFIHSDGVWTEQAKLVASDGAAQDSFGETTALSADGDTALVGASFADPGGSNQQGAAWVFTRNGEVWSEQAKLTAADGAPLDSFGRSQVALSGDTALVGAPTADVDGNENQGAAYVFTRSGEVWTEQAKLTASDGATAHLFGTAALQGDTALIGAGGNAALAAYVFTRSDGIWTEQAKLTASDGPLARGFGSRVALWGDTVLIGASAAPVDANSAQGAAYVFGRDAQCTLPDWVGVDPPGGSVPGDEAQVVDVTFDASDLGTGELTATLCLASNDPVTPLVTVPLTLIVTETPEPVLVFEPPSLDFGDVEVGSTSEPQTATLENIGDADATGLTFDPPGSGFDADTEACSGTLPAGESCVISVTFAPMEPGPAEAELHVSSEQDAAALLGLIGNGVGAGGFTAMALEVDPEPRVSDGNGVFEPDEAVDVAPAWRNDGTVADSLAGTASDFTGPEGADYTLEAPDANYGLIEPGETASCLDTEVCYQLGVDDPAVRPATHWEATFDETLDDTAGTTKTWTLHIGGSFIDVPVTNAFYPFVETLLHSGVTGGCTDTEYCPTANNTRDQMPVFVLRAVEGADYQPPACVEGAEVFHDVSADNVFCPWIEELANRGVVSGCGGDNYCPNAPVTRAQMSIFLLRTLEGSDYEPPACTSQFVDVPCPSLFADWIEELFAREITGGCSNQPLRYCPANPVNREQMATFVSRAFELTLYGL